MNKSAHDKLLAAAKQKSPTGNAIVSKELIGKVIAEWDECRAALAACQERHALRDVIDKKASTLRAEERQSRPVPKKKLL